MTALIGSATTALWAPASSAVALRTKAVVLPRFGNEPELVLDLASLQMLEALFSPEGLSVDGVAPGNELLSAVGRPGHCCRVAAGDSPGTDLADADADADPASSEPDDDGQVVLPTPLLLSCGPTGSSTSTMTVSRDSLHADRGTGRRAFRPADDRGGGWSRARQRPRQRRAARLRVRRPRRTSPVAGLLVPFDPHAPGSRPPDAAGRGHARRHAPPGAGARGVRSARGRARRARRPRPIACGSSAFHHQLVGPAGVARR